jgi:chromosome partitioning protein
LKRDKIPFLFILNQIKANANITAQAVAALSHHGPVAETFIVDRVPYASAMTDGRTALELTPRTLTNCLDSGSERVDKSGHLCSDG